MSNIFTKGKNFITKKGRGELLLIEAWSENCIRVRCTLNQDFFPYDWVINPIDTALAVSISEDDEKFILQNGKISLELKKGTWEPLLVSETPLRFFKTETGENLLEEKVSQIVPPDPGHSLKSVGPSSFKAEVRFKADPTEKFFGLGHNQQGFLNQKGCSLELCQMNAHTIVPVLYSSKGYGFFWNNPAYGRVELVNNGTYWIAENTDQIDYFVFTGDTPSEIMKMYAQLTGFPSMMPDWAMGFWQCKLRYRNQQELLSVAQEHKARGLPMSVIVIDFFHWDKMGEWDFDRKCWPEPEKMLKDLKKLGIETMVSIWPTVNVKSSNCNEMLEKDYLVRAETGAPVFKRFIDTYDNIEYFHLTDFTNDDAGKYVWQIAEKNYYDRGVRLFWLDECEPDVRPSKIENLRYKIGNGAKVSSLYPLFAAKTFYEGMKESGEELPINLCRSAWAGSQKYGTCVWAGDIASTFESFRNQIKNSLNMAMAGIPWWTTDIGGFFGGDIHDPEFKELIIRWFQWGVFCPIFRLHGFRNSWDMKNGGDNEVWSFGAKEYEIIKDLLFLRETLKPYIKEQMSVANRTGTPPMRPLFYDFPQDDQCYDIEDQLLFGPDILIAPITEYKHRSRDVYLPDGVDWRDATTRESYQGGQNIQVEAPLEIIPVFTRNNAEIADIFTL